MIRKGDEEALIQLYKSNQRAITSFIERNSGSQDDARDLLQEALMVLWERVRSGKHEYTAQLSTFIFATVKNMWFRRLARKRRESASLQDVDNTPDGNPSQLDDMVQTERAEIVRNALERLGDPCRTLLLMYYWEELSLEQIAVKLQFANATTVKSKKYQCKKALEKLLKGSLL